MVPRRLGHTGIDLSPIGFGAFKIGRNQAVKYAQPYALPSEGAVESLVNGILDLGITYIDTAPAYGLSEARIGAALAIHPRGRAIIVSTKVGERFDDGASTFDFSEQGIRNSIEQSRVQLQREALDLVFIHSSGDDLNILESTPAVRTLKSLREQGLIRAIGFSGKSIAGAEAALPWADALMVEYHLEDRSHEEVIARAGRNGVGVVVKKGLASGRLPAAESIRFVLANPHVTSIVIGGLNLAHFRENVSAAS